MEIYKLWVNISTSSNHKLHVYSLTNGFYAAEVRDSINVVFKEIYNCELKALKAFASKSKQEAAITFISPFHHNQLLTSLSKAFILTFDIFQGEEGDRLFL